jgi:hypothetical protein
MRKHSSAFYHRIMLISVLVFGATLLLLNAWMVSNSEAELLLTPWLVR